MTTHNVEVNVTANTQQAQKSLSYLQSLMGEFGKQATNRFAAMLGAAAVAKMAFDKVSQAISANIATAKQVSQMAIKFNIDPVAMHSITMAAKDAGVSVRALTMSMKQLGKYAEKAMSSKEAQANFKQLGIEANKLNEIQASPSKFLPEIAKALMEIGDENQRSAAGATLLGRQYQMLLPLIEELGTSEEARAKFLENDNAMTEEQIAANKEIAKIQNDLSDGFDKMVAAAAPLLGWAMTFISLLADGLGYIKDMIWESEKARKERETKSVAKVANKIESYESSLRAKQESGTLTDYEREGIEKEGSIEGFVSKNVATLDKSFKTLRIMQAEGLMPTADREYRARMLNPAKFKRAEELQAILDSSIVADDFAKAMGVFHTQVGKSFEIEDKLLFGNIAFRDDDAEKYHSAAQDIHLASERKDLEKLAGPGREKTAALLRGKAAKAEEANIKAEMAKYIEVRKKQATLLGQVYDPVTDKAYSKGEYASLLETRGASKEEIGLKIRSFEKEEDRIKREKQVKASERKLASSERKLYVGSKEEGKYKQGLDEAEKAAEALEDAKRAQDAPLEDLRDQQKIYADLASDLYDAQFGDPHSEEDNSQEILRLTAQLEVEKVKLNDLQSKANDLKGQEIAAEEALKRAKENVYREELKRSDEVEKRIKAESDHEKQLKYKVMKAEGKSQRDITKERLKDEETEYGAMLERYKKKYDEAMKNEAKGLKGEPLSEKEIAELEGLTKELEAKKRGILDTAFDLGNQEDKGQATSMRRIGGGGMEYGGLGNTAKQQLDVARRSLRKLEEIGILLNPKLQQIQGEKSGLTYGQFVSGVTASDSSPR